MMRFKNSIAPKKMFQFETLKKSICFKALKLFPIFAAGTRVYDGEKGEKTSFSGPDTKQSRFIICLFDRKTSYAATDRHYTIRNNREVA